MNNNIENLEVKRVYPERTYERQNFTLSVNNEDYSGDLNEGEVQWRQPQPNQNVSENLEAEVQRLIEQQSATKLKNRES